MSAERQLGGSFTSSGLGSLSVGALRFVVVRGALFFAGADFFAATFLLDVAVLLLLDLLLVELALFVFDALALPFELRATSPADVRTVRSGVAAAGAVAVTAGGGGAGVGAGGVVAGAAVVGVACAVVGASCATLLSPSRPAMNGLAMQS